MPEGVSFWTGVWDPKREALSHEVSLIRAALHPRGTVVSIAAGQRTRLKIRDRVIQLSGRRWHLLRALAASLERRAHVTHVFGEMNAWHLLRAVGRRPVLFTVAIPGPALPKALLDKVTMFVPESEPLALGLQQAGVEMARIRVVHPGVDLTRFHPTGDRPVRFTVLFASSPSTPDHFEARGILLLIEAARLCPEVDFRLIWRTWGDVNALKHALAAHNPPVNVINEWRDVPDMAGAYQAAHAIAFMPADDHGKSCPNSVIEALASGCPALVSASCGIAGLVDGAGAGLVVSRDPQALAAAIRGLKAEFAGRSRAARALALLQFDVNGFLSAYRRLYDEIGRNGVVDSFGPTHAPAIVHRTALFEGTRASKSRGMRA